MKKYTTIAVEVTLQFDGNLTDEELEEQLDNLDIIATDKNGNNVYSVLSNYCVLDACRTDDL